MKNTRIFETYEVSPKELIEFEIFVKDGNINRIRAIHLVPRNNSRISNNYLWTPHTETLQFESYSDKLRRSLRALINHDFEAFRDLFHSLDNSTHAYEVASELLARKIEKTNQLLEALTKISF